MLPEDPQNQNGPATASSNAAEPAHEATSAKEEVIATAQAGAEASHPADDDENRHDLAQEIQPSDSSEAPAGDAVAASSSPELSQQQEGDSEGAEAVSPESVSTAPEGASPDDPSTFLDLLADTNEAAAAFEEILWLGAAPAFTGFDSGVGPQPAPAFHVALHSIDLIRAVQLLEACTPKSQKLGPVRISVTAKEVNVQAFPDAFFELRIEPISVHGLNGQDKAVLFIQGDDLRRTCAALDDDVELRHVPALNLLHVSSGNFERPIVLADHSTFTPLNQKNIGEIDPAEKQAAPPTLAQGVKYVAPHVVQNPLQPWFSVIDCNKGMVVGGASFVIARFSAPDLHGVDFCFDHRYADLVLLVLDGVEEPSLYATNYFSIIRTYYLSIGIPKPIARSKIVNLMIEPDFNQHCRFPWSTLSNSLERVEHAFGPTILRIRAKEPGDTKAELTAAGKDGASIRETIDVNSSYDHLDVRVQSDILAAAIAKERSANVDLHLCHNALIINHSDDKIAALTAIAQTEKKSNEKPLLLEYAHESATTEEP